MDEYVLGISSFYHDSAATLINNGEIVAAVQEERFTRKKHDSSFPINAVKYCLTSQGIDLRDIKSVVYYEKPLLTFERLLETYLGAAPRGIRSFVTAMQVWLKDKLFLKSELKRKLDNIQKELVPEVRSNIPKPQGATILHNDFKLDNIMWDVDNPLLPVAVFDWDMCTRGDALMDLGHLLNYWIDEDDDYEANLITSMPVKNILYPKKNEIIDHYALKTGFSIKDVDWYYAFGAFKLAVIIQQIYVRFLKGQTQDERFANFGKRIEALINRANRVFNFNQRCKMNFEYSNKVKDLQDKLKNIMNEHVYKNEAVYK